PAQLCDPTAPVSDDGVEQGIQPQILQPPLAEGEFVLRIDQGSRCPWLHLLDAARVKDAIRDDVLILACRDDAVEAHFVCKLLADHLALPYTAAPQGDGHNQQERQVDRQMQQRATPEGLEK